MVSFLVSGKIYKCTGRGSQDCKFLTFIDTELKVVVCDNQLLAYYINWDTITLSSISYICYTLLCKKYMGVQDHVYWVLCPEKHAQRQVIKQYFSKV